MNNKIQVIKRLRIIGFLEGVSYLILLFISMPLKYLFHYPQAVLVNGWIHGALFVLFALAVLQAWIVCRWAFKRAFVAGLLSLVPFGTFLFDKTLKEEQATYQE
jgi:integral membrane protein